MSVLVLEVSKRTTDPGLTVEVVTEVVVVVGTADNGYECFRCRIVSGDLRSSLEDDNRDPVAKSGSPVKDG